jgi:hypothetical protein
MKVNATMLDASLGRTTGGAVVTVTKAGTNKVHGTLYGFGRWKGLNANSWSNDLNHVPRPDVNYYQTGYFLGGPVVIPHLYDRRNRPFFASAYERDNDVRDLSETTRVPTAAETHGDLNPFPNGITQPVGTASGTLTQMGSSISFVNPNRVVPYSQQWQFSVQQGLTKGADLQVAYVGMLSLKEFESFDLSDLPLALSVSTQNNQVANPSSVNCRRIPHLERPQPSPSITCRRHSRSSPPSPRMV